MRITPTIKYQLLLIFWIFTHSEVSFCQKSENRYHIVQFGITSLEYLNSSSIPSGLPGKGNTVDYIASLKNNNPKTNHEFHFRLIYAELKQTFSENYISRPYHHFEFSSTVARYYSNPITNRAVDIEAGVGLSMNALFGMNKLAYTINMQPYGNWCITPNLTARASYSRERLSFRASVSAPVLAIGFFRKLDVTQPQSYNKPLQFISFYGIPNTVALPGKFNKIDMSGLITYLLFKNEKNEIRLLTQLEWQGVKLNIHGNREMKSSNSLSVGLKLNRL